MDGPGESRYEFAITLHATIDLNLITGTLTRVAGEMGDRLISAEIHARPDAGEIILLWCTRASTYSISWAVQQEAGRLQGKALDLTLAGKEVRDRFLRLRVRASEIHLDAARDPVGAVRELRARFGLEGPQPIVQLRYESEDAIWFAYIRQLAEGAFFVPAPKPARSSAEVRVVFTAPGQEALPCKGRVLDRPPEPGRQGFYAELTPTFAFTEFLERRARARKEGRSLGTAGGKRAHARFDTCLEVELRNYPELSAEYVTNISKGGMFVRTRTPPELGAAVKLAVRLPNGELVETEAEVVHVVTVEDAAANRTFPGVGLSFRARNAEFHEPFGRLIAEYQRRRPRVLAVDDDALFRIALRDGLGAAGLDTDTAADGHEAFQKLLDGLYQYDLLVLDLEMPGMDGRTLIDRIRRVGGEADLRIAVLTGSDEESHQDLKGIGGANEVIGKYRPPTEVIRRLLAVLGRDSGS